MGVGNRCSPWGHVSAWITNSCNSSCPPLPGKSSPCGGSWSAGHSSSSARTHGSSTTPASRRTVRLPRGPSWLMGASVGRAWLSGCSKVPIRHLGHWGPLALSGYTPDRENGEVLGQRPVTALPWAVSERLPPGRYALPAQAQVSNIAPIRWEWVERVKAHLNRAHGYRPDLLGDCLQLAVSRQHFAVSHTHCIFRQVRGNVGSTGFGAPTTEPDAPLARQKGRRPVRIHRSIRKRETGRATDRSGCVGKDHYPGIPTQRQHLGHRGWPCSQALAGQEHLRDHRRRRQDDLGHDRRRQALHLSLIHI